MVRLAVQHAARIHFLFAVRGTFHPDPADALAIGIGLSGNQLFAKAGGRKTLHLVGCAAQFDAARSAPAPGRNLRFHNPS